MAAPTADPQGARPTLAGIARLLDGPPTYTSYLAASNAVERLPRELDARELRIALLANFTIDPLLPVLRGEAARAGARALTYVAPFDSVGPETHNPASGLYGFDPNVVILAQWLDSLSPALTSRFVTLRAPEVDAEIDRVLAHIESACAAIRARSQAPILVNNFPLPAYTTLGILDAQGTDQHTQTVVRLNRELIARARAMRDVYVVDYMSIFARIGASAVDRRYWHVGRAPLGRASLVPLGQEYGRFMRALLGTAKKCLVLDCDNTLWGGIVGEDGPTGIQLGTQYPGSAFVAFQREILNLHERGVILAVCSKNNEADVREVFRSHPEMVLRESHIAAWQVNWDDKATNIRRVASELNIGLDSLVFVDDSEFECGLIRDQVPEVEVVTLTGEPAGFVDGLQARGFFDTLSLSAEDRERGRMYAGERQRRHLEETSASLEDYLVKLGIEAEITPANARTIPRVSQLTQRTNQFNLTTRRYTEGDIQRMVEDPAVDVLTVTVRDKVAPLGLVGVAIVNYGETRASIDSFLLSCRAIGRGVEQALLSTVTARAAERGCRAVEAQFIPTKKNGLAAEFLPKSGFTAAGSSGAATSWQLPLETGGIAPPHWIRLVTRNDEAANAE